MSWVKFTCEKRRSTARAALYANGIISFNEGACLRFGIRLASAVVYYYDNEERRIGIELTNDGREEGARIIRKRRTGASAAAKPFLDKYGIRPDITTVFPLTREESSGYIVIRLGDGEQLVRKRCTTLAVRPHIYPHRAKSAQLQQNKGKQMAGKKCKPSVTTELPTITATEVLNRLLDNQPITRRIGLQRAGMLNATEATAVFDAMVQISQATTLDGSPLQQVLFELMTERPELIPQLVTVYGNLPVTKITLANPGQLYEMANGTPSAQAARALIERWSQSTYTPLARAAEQALQRLWKIS